jgi:hypothetical protein
MPSGATRNYLAGCVTGAGLALFVLYILSQAIPITLERWPRIAVSAVGLALNGVGFTLRPRPTKPGGASGAGPGSVLSTAGS